MPKSVIDEQEVIAQLIDQSSETCAKVFPLMRSNINVERRTDLIGPDGEDLNSMAKVNKEI